MTNLTQGVFVFLFGQMVLGNLKELILTKVTKWWRHRKTRKPQKEHVLEQWEMDYSLLPWNGLLYEYLEIVIQFCFLTMFSVAFPPAPLIILMNNWIEIRLDAKKFLLYYQRPIPERVKDNGIFLTILTWIVHIAVLFHALLIAFSSDFLPRLMYYFTATATDPSYLEFILAYSPQKYVDETHTPCRYKGFRDEEGNYTAFHWQLLVLQIVFVIVFVIVMLFIMKTIGWLIHEDPNLEKYHEPQKTMNEDDDSDSEELQEVKVEK
uniref:anoctamin-7-like n=2 Tax=Myxine glutinosa TaxID=7769 RepID=UPI00358E7F15